MTISPVTIIFLVAASIFHAATLAAVVLLVAALAWEALLAWGRYEGV